MNKNYLLGMSILTLHKQFTVDYSYILRNCQNQPATSKFMQYRDACYHTYETTDLKWQA